MPFILHSYMQACSATAHMLRCSFFFFFFFFSSSSSFHLCLSQPTSTTELTSPTLTLKHHHLLLLFPLLPNKPPRCVNIAPRTHTHAVAMYICIYACVERSKGRNDDAAIAVAIAVAANGWIFRVVDGVTQLIMMTMIMQPRKRSKERRGIKV
ncbi:hypothetical protein IWX50DRAFT_1712 [Phyllosticta citricarpa]